MKIKYKKVTKDNDDITANSVPDIRHLQTQTEIPHFCLVFLYIVLSKILLNLYHVQWVKQLFERLEFSMQTGHAKLSGVVTKRINLFKI